MKFMPFLLIMALLVGCSSTNKVEDAESAYYGGTVLCYAVTATFGSGETGMACYEAVQFLND